MGLFSNNKKLCPICGAATPRFLPIKVEDVPICKVCDKKIFLPEGTLEKMSLDEFKEYMNYYEENQVLRDKFSPTYEYQVGYSWMKVKLDPVNGLFALHAAEHALVFESSCIQTYRILEDDEPLFQGNQKAIKFFESKVPEKVRSLGPMFAEFQIKLKEYEMLERMEDMLERADDDDNHTRRYHSRPSFDAPEPFKQFKVRVRLEHPYWQGSHQGKIDAPTFNAYDPSAEYYMNEYNEKVDELHNLALQFKELVNPNSKEIYAEDTNMAEATAQAVPPVAQAAPAVDTVEEIKKFKELLDMGIITEEEFAAKKKQLLGI